MKKRQEQHTQRVNRACLTGKLAIGKVLLQDLGVGMNGSHRDLIRACGHDLLLRCQMLLEVLAILVHHGLGRRLFGGGVGDLGGRCHARAGGRGMWDVEGGGGWGSGVDYLPG